VRRPAFTLEQIRSFVAVAEHNQISRAAVALFLTQAAVTQQVRHFEKALGLELVERDGRGVRLTDAGRSMAEACRAVLRAVEVMDDTAHAVKDLQAGSLHLGASPTCASYYAPPYLAELLRRHPGIKLDVVVEMTAGLNRKVASGTLDGAVIEGQPDPELVSFELAKDEMVLVAHRQHPLAELRRVSVEELSRHRYLRRAPDWSGEVFVRDLMGPAYARLEVMDLGHAEYVRAAVAAGLGFALLPKRAVAADLASGLLGRLPFAPVVRPITAIRRRTAGAPALEAFWALITGAGKINPDGRGKKP
jgi:DNA-binding transcriptional LysR family regulator